MPTTNPSFGFAVNVTGGGDSPSTTDVTNVGQLRSALNGLASPKKVAKAIIIHGGTYTFTHEAFPIQASNVTIQARPGDLVTLQNVQFNVDVNYASNLLIQDLAFQSDRSEAGARDAIVLDIPEGSDAVSDSASRAAAVRITHCSFDGYFDIAIDSHTRSDRRLLAATIDHCLFFDSDPGKPDTAQDGKNALLFTNRGAINIAGVAVSATQNLGNARVTIANNAFVDVWRRSPRIAEGTFGHIFNNLLFRWGFGNDADTTGDSQNSDTKTNSWVGMAGGGGEEGRSVPNQNGTALIQANRFIPWKKKALDTKTVDIDPNSTVDLRFNHTLRNRFDDNNGNENTSFFLQRSVNVDLATFRETLPKPDITAANAVNWRNLLDDAGPRGTSEASTPQQKARQRVIDHVGMRL
ncbi:MAG: hypothetical protein ACJ74H_14960 [Thermoanaerobaculia bacterium]